MNVYDSERILEALDKKGITETKDSDESDLVIFNTCHIREKAAEKLYSDIGRLKKQNNTKNEHMSNKQIQTNVERRNQKHIQGSLSTDGPAMLEAATNSPGRPSHPGRLGLVLGSDPALDNGPCSEWD